MLVYIFVCFHLEMNYLSNVMATIMKIDAAIAILLPGYRRYGNRCT